MAPMLGAFLLWLFASGKYADWAALITSGAAPANTGGAEGSWTEPTPEETLMKNVLENSLSA